MKKHTDTFEYCGLVFTYTFHPTMGEERTVYNFAPEIEVFSAEASGYEIIENLKDNFIDDAKVAILEWLIEEAREEQ